MARVSEGAEQAEKSDAGTEREITVVVVIVTIGGAVSARQYITALLPPERSALITLSLVQEVVRWVG